MTTTTTKGSSKASGTDAGERGGRSPRLWLAALAPLLFLAAGCKVWMPLALADVPTAIERGDRVRIKLRDGGRIELEVQTIDTEAIVGPEGRVLLSDVARLERRQLDSKRTLLLLLGLGAVAFLLVVGVVAASLSAPP